VQGHHARRRDRASCATGSKWRARTLKRSPATSTFYTRLLVTSFAASGAIAGSTVTRTVPARMRATLASSLDDRMGTQVEHGVGRLLAPPYAHIRCD
jgi:hypothetical protein